MAKTREQVKRKTNQGGATKFKKGASGNPGGRPKKEVSLTHLLREFAKLKHKRTSKTNAEALIEQVWGMAFSGDKFAVNLLFERIEGCPEKVAGLRRLAGRAGGCRNDQHGRGKEHGYFSLKHIL